MMTKFTKTANYIFRGTIAAAFGAIALTMVRGGELLGKVFETAKDTETALADMAGLDFTGILGNAKMVPMVLLLAVILSCVAFKCAGKAASITRTVALVCAAGFAAGSTALLGMADTITRSIQGTVTADEAELVKPIIDAFAKEGPEAAAGGAAMTGAFLMACAGVIVAILIITSIVSVVKTIKASSNNTMEMCAA